MPDISPNHKVILTLRTTDQEHGINIRKTVAATLIKPNAQKTKGIDTNSITMHISCR